MTPKLQHTKSYALFVANDEQRPIHPPHVKILADSMKAFGYFPDKPIRCYKQGNKLVVVDGHHRLAAAKSIGIQVCYMVMDKDCQRGMIATGEQKQWSSEDCVRLYALRGLPDYVELQQYGEHMPISLAASLLSGESAAAGNQRRTMRNGTFRIKTRIHANIVVSIIKELGDKNDALRSRSFIDAISKCLLTPEFDLEQFKMRLRQNISMLEKTSNSGQMLKLIEDIYNFRSGKKIPVAFYVMENSRKRHESFGKSNAA